LCEPVTKYEDSSLVLQKKKTENGLTFKNMQVLVYSQAFCYYYLQKIYTAKVVFKINQTDKNQII